MHLKGDPEGETRKKKKLETKCLKSKNQYNPCCPGAHNSVLTPPGRMLRSLGSASLACPQRLAPSALTDTVLKWGRHVTLQA